MVSWYQTQLADAHLTIANLSAANHTLSERVKELTEKEDPNG